MARKKYPKGAKMTAVSSRLDNDNAEWLPDFLGRTAASQSRIVNECLRLGREVLERRLREGETLTKPPPRHGGDAHSE
jgi:hypothetical protein